MGASVGKGGCAETDAELAETEFARDAALSFETKARSSFRLLVSRDLCSLLVILLVAELRAMFHYCSRSVRRSFSSRPGSRSAARCRACARTAPHKGICGCSRHGHDDPLCPQCRPREHRRWLSHKPVVFLLQKVVTIIRFKIEVHW